MDMGERRREHLVLPALGRRRFLTGAAATAAALAVGCSSDGSDGSAGGGTSTTAAQSTTTVHTAKLSGDPFAIGVASGDPLADRVILWTRLAPDVLAEDGLGGMPADKVDVVWEVATDERFTKQVTGGVFTAEADHGHAVHVDATGLEPGTEYHYRFRVGDFTSPTGRTKTLADGSPERFGLAIVNCQMFEAGTYAAYRHLLDEDVDLVAHLGDYIYEYPGSVMGGERRSAPDRMLKDLVDFRLRYGSYKLDPDLLAAHARFPFFVTWDDHEVSNNYMGDERADGADPEVLKAMKAAAYQAWWEHMPVRLDAPTDADLAIYRDLAVGDLARLYLLDQRQDADVPPCRDEGVSSALDYGNCEAVEAEDRTRLGTGQEDWLAGALAEGGTTWNLLGNPVVLAGVDAGTDEAAYYLDTWDGYPQARRRLIAQLAEVSNPVVLTGDYHAGMVLDVHARPFEQDSAIVAPEFMAPPISSTLFSADISARTPQLRTQINAHGYLTVDVTPDLLTCTFRTLEDVSKADTPISTASTWTVTPGNPVAEEV